MTLEVLHVRDCPNLALLLERLSRVTDLPVGVREIGTGEDAARHGMSGSPTLLVNGFDPFASGEPCEGGVSCRIYRDGHGDMVSVPSVDQLRDAIASGEPTPEAGPIRAGEVLSAWRTRAVPLEPDEVAIHRAILRCFAATGAAPTAEDLDAVPIDCGRSTNEVLSALHDVDAIRLAPDGQVVVAYPFSVRPTRHRVRLADRIEVYAMCAIDALGMAPMLEMDTLIRSVDATTGQPVTVTTIEGRATWAPASAVALIGADAGGGPSVDCCCDYLNFFTNADAARAWLDAHPEVPGQVLTQSEAERLGARLFGQLLSDRP